MIDLIRLPKYSTVECSLADIPTILAEKAKIHLLDDEEVLICVVERDEGESVKVQLVTRLRLVVIKGFVDKGVIKHAGEQTFNPEDASMRLGDLVGLTHHEVTLRNGHHHYYLKAVAVNLTIGLEFWNADLLRKFSQVLLRSADDLRTR